MTFEDFGNPTVLVADDELLITELVTAILRHKRCQVLTAATADEALDVTKRHRDDISVILLDYSLGRNNHLTACIQNESDAKLILMSGYPEEVARNSGVTYDEFLQKPFTSAAVVNAVRKVLGCNEFLPCTNIACTAV